MQRIEREPAAGGSLEARARAARARTFVEVESAAWISQLLGAVQRREGALIAGLCRQMRMPLHVLGAHDVLERLHMLEASSFCYGPGHTFLVSRALMRDLIVLIDRLGAQLDSWDAPGECGSPPPSPRLPVPGGSAHRIDQ